jgi:hypothetical protein
VKGLSTPGPVRATVRMRWAAARGTIAPLLRHGSRRVVMTSDALRIGNLLYVWLSCHRRRALGEDVRALANAHTRAWDELWSLTPRGLVVTRERMRVWDRREDVSSSHLQAFGTDFSHAELRAFASEVLLSGRFRDLLAPDDEVLTLNVRRGDYYSDPAYRARYAFDVQGYLREAVDISLRRQGRPSGIRVVSDDPTWCRTHLGWLTEVVPHVEWAEAEPVNGLAALASSRRLILANSSFSYWGGYLSRVVHGADGSSIVAPRFHVRDVNGGVAWQLDPSWIVVDGHW